MLGSEAEVKLKRKQKWWIVLQGVVAQPEIAMLLLSDGKPYVFGTGCYNDGWRPWPGDCCLADIRQKGKVSQNFGYI